MSLRRRGRRPDRLDQRRDPPHDTTIGTSLGKITIGEDSARFDDRVLSHLEAVIVSKLRRSESFLFTWTIDVSLGSGRIAKWIHPALDLDFRFDTRKPARMNVAWVEELMRAANSPLGLSALPEPVPEEA